MQDPLVNKRIAREGFALVLERCSLPIEAAHQEIFLAYRNVHRNWYGPFGTKR
jgi:hypothetical protein